MVFVADIMADNSEGSAQVLILSGVRQAQSGDLVSAASLLEQVLRLPPEQLSLQERGLASGNLALVHHWLGDYSAATEIHLQSLEVDQQVGLVEDMTGSWPDYLWGEYTLDRQVGSLASQGYGYFNLGFTYYWQNDYVKAIASYERSLAIAKEIGDRINEIRVLAQMGEVYFYLADYGLSLDYHQRAIALADEIGIEAHSDLLGSKANSLNSAGNALIKLGRWDEAEERYQASLALVGEQGNPNIVGNALACIGITRANQGDYDKSIAYFTRSLEQIRSIQNRYNEGRLLGLLGQTYAFKGDYPAALTYQRQSLAISRELQDAFSQALTLSELGLTLFRLNELLGAETYLREAIALSESIRAKLGQNNRLKVSIFERQAEPYQLLQMVLVAQHHYGAALEIAERGRARALVELLGQRQGTTQSLPPDSLPQVPDLGQLRQIAVQQQATLVEYSVIQTKGLESSYLLIWVITPEGDLHFRQSNLGSSQNVALSLETLVESTCSAVGVMELGRVGTPDPGRDILPTSELAPGPEAANAMPALQQLYNLLIEPIARLLSRHSDQTVIFVPQGALFGVPFAALLSPAEEYLIERFACALTPSIQTLALTNRPQQHPRPTQALVVGNPAQAQLGFGNTALSYALSPLPEAEREARRVADLLGSDVILGSAATKALVQAQMPEATVIHLAAHGLLDEEQGLSSAIALAPTETDNGLLTATEIIELSLQADLVVLSACNTGRGRITGDGVIGLSRAFMEAGVPSVVVSLWAVPDAPTAKLMVAFYEGLQRGLDWAQALRGAMLAVIAEHPHPKDWAAFVVVGDRGHTAQRSL